MKHALPKPVEHAQRALASARALYAAGLVPECHAAIVLALRTLLGAWQPAKGAGEAPHAEDERSEDERALDAISRAGYRRLDRLRAALATSVPVAATSQAPTEAVTPVELPDDFETIWAETERLSRFTTRRKLLPHARKRIRIALALGLGATLLAATLITVRLWYRPRALASAVMSWEFPAAHAVDGIEATEWLLPDKTTGWLDVVFSSPRDIRTVRILNVHNRYWADRASQHVRVTAFNEWRALGSVEGHYDGIKRERSPLDLSLRAEGVTRIRAEVLSSFGLGGGFAEIEAH